MTRPLRAKVVAWIVSTFTGGDPKTIIQALLSEKRTGQLTIHISQGGIGTIEWKERGSSLTASKEGVEVVVPPADKKMLDTEAAVPLLSTS